MYTLHIESEFAAAHSLRGYEGQCERLHGHNWRVQVALEAASLDDVGMAMDFKVAKSLLADALKPFDHQNLNDLPEFARQNPTTENLSRIVFEALSKILPSNVAVKSVTTWESDRCGATYQRSRQKSEG